MKLYTFLDPRVVANAQLLLYVLSVVIQICSYSIDEPVSLSSCPVPRTLSVVTEKRKKSYRYMWTYMYISWILKYIFLTRKSMNFDFPAFTQYSSKNDIDCWWYSLNISTLVREHLCLIITCIHINTMKTTISWGLQAWLHLLGAVSSGMLSICNPLSI